MSATPISATSHFVGFAHNDSGAFPGAAFGGAAFAGAAFGGIHACSLWNCANHAIQSP